MPVFRAIFYSVGMYRVVVGQPRQYRIHVTDVTQDGEPVKSVAYIAKPPRMFETVGELTKGDIIEWQAPKIECRYPQFMHKVET